MPCEIAPPAGSLLPSGLSSARGDDAPARPCRFRTEAERFRRVHGVGRVDGEARIARGDVVDLAVASHHPAPLPGASNLLESPWQFLPPVPPVPLPLDPLVPSPVAADSSSASATSPSPSADGSVALTSRPGQGSSSSVGVAPVQAGYSEGDRKDGVKNGTSDDERLDEATRNPR